MVRKNKICARVAICLYRSVFAKSLYVEVDARDAGANCLGRLPWTLDARDAGPLFARISNQYTHTHTHTPSPFKKHFDKIWAKNCSLFWSKFHAKRILNCSSLTFRLPSILFATPLPGRKQNGSQAEGELRTV